MIKKLLKYLCFCIFIATSAGMLNACVSVKAYQKMYLNDEDMKLKLRHIETSEINFQSYREGASGANKGKTGGGCGCN